MTNNDNDRKLKKLVTSLNHRLSPTVYFISTNTERLRKKLYETITKAASRYQHIYIDLTPHLVYSLRDAITQLVPAEIFNSSPLTYIVHFTGISSSLFTSAGGELKKSKLAEELNFERETLFHDYPFISIIWVNPFFFNELFYRAGDLMSWTVDRFEFIDEYPDSVTHEIPHKEPLQKKGVFVGRTERIKELEDLLDRLNEEDPNQRRIMLEKANAYLLLGREYMTAFHVKEAEENMLKAVSLAEKASGKSEKQLEALISLGDLYKSANLFSKSIDFYLTALAIAEEVSTHNVQGIYHQLGISYTYLPDYHKALECFNKAIEWQKKTGHFTLGSTFHQIGILFAEQGRWEEALTYYKLALDWKKEAGNEYELGTTYYQIGRLFYNQHRYEDALSNFQQALELYEQTGNEFELADAYHYLGSIYENRHDLERAVFNYKKSLESWEKIGYKGQKGAATYYQIAGIYLKQGLLQKAKENMQIAITHLPESEGILLQLAKKLLYQIETILAAGQPTK